MSITSRMFEGDADLLRMRDFLIAANASGRPGYWHIGDLIWGVYQNTIFDPRASIRLWEDAGGELLGFAWREEPDGLSIQVHPRLRGSGLLEQQMLDWGAAICARPSRLRSCPLAGRCVTSAMSQSGARASRRTARSGTPHA